MVPSLHAGERIVKIGIASLGRVAEDTGGKNYLIQFVSRLDEYADRHKFVLFLSEGEKSLLHLEEQPWLKIVSIPGTKRTPLHKVIGEQLLLPRAARREKIDVLYCPGNFVPIMSAIPLVVNIRATAHFYGIKYGIRGMRRFIRTRLMPASARAASAIITPSEDIKRDVVRFCQVGADKIAVIPHGVDTTLFSPSLRDSPEYTATLDRLGLQRPYLLYVSALWEYKNHERLLRAHPLLLRENPDLRLVIAGLGTGTDPRYVSRLHALPAELGTADRVIFTGAQPQSVLRYLYAGARAFVFPSLYESFGNPIFEAWASGTPVVTSNVHSFPEIVADAGLTFDPTDIQAMATTIDRVLRDDALRATLVDRGLERVKKFTWDVCVRRTLSLIERVSEL
jgi:glycosyltransferase involved in cell wall biosynthesis